MNMKTRTMTTPNRGLPNEIGGTVNLGPRPEPLAVCSRGRLGRAIGRRVVAPATGHAESTDDTGDASNASRTRDANSDEHTRLGTCCARPASGSR